MRYSVPLLVLLLLAATITAGCMEQEKADSPEQSFTCPDQPTINCMPGPDERHPACSGNYSQWVQENCNVTLAY